MQLMSNGLKVEHALCCRTHFNYSLYCSFSGNDQLSVTAYPDQRVLANKLNTKVLAKDQLQKSTVPQDPNLQTKMIVMTTIDSV